MNQETPNAWQSAPDMISEISPDIAQESIETCETFYSTDGGILLLKLLAGQRVELSAVYDGDTIVAYVECYKQLTVNIQNPDEYEVIDTREDGDDDYDEVATIVQTSMYNIKGDPEE